MSHVPRVAKPTVAICAMGKRPFTETARRWIDRLREAGFETFDHRAVQVRRDVVIADLNGDADIVIYVGHGRQRGWSGYQTIRWRHVEPTQSVRPVQAVFAFACYTAGHESDDAAFAHRLVGTGRASSYVGWAHPAAVEPGLALANQCIDELTQLGDGDSVATLLDRLSQRLSRTDERDLFEELVVLGDRHTTLGRANGGRIRQEAHLVGAT